MNKLIIIFVSIAAWTKPILAEELEEKVLDFHLKDLYVFHTPVLKGDVVTDHFLEMVLTTNLHVGSPEVEEVALKDHKYVIYVANKDFKLLRTFSFYFGGYDQFAVQTSDEKEVLIGKVGEYIKGAWYRAFAGLRADLAFYDRVGYRNFIQNGCLPVVGFRCEGAGRVENFFQNKNVLAIGLSLNVKGIAINANQVASPNQFKVWAKAFKSDE